MNSRFSDLKPSIPGISQRMLTATVRNLEREAILTRHVYAEVPPRVEYELTRPSTEFMRLCTAECWPMINEKETPVASNEEIIRNLYAVAEKEPKQFRSLFTKNGYWWDVPAGVKYRGDEVARAADIYSAAFPDMHRELSHLYFDGDVVVV